MHSERHLLATLVDGGAEPDGAWVGVLARADQILASDLRALVEERGQRATLSYLLPTCVPALSPILAAWSSGNDGSYAALVECLDLTEADTAARLDWSARVATQSEAEAIAAWAARDRGEVRYLRRTRLWRADDRPARPIWHGVEALRPDGAVWLAVEAFMGPLAVADEEAGPLARRDLTDATDAIDSHVRTARCVEAALRCANIARRQRGRGPHGPHGPYDLTLDGWSPGIARGWPVRRE